MSTRMLIDARHKEETRVTVVKGSRVEEFDYESATKRPLKGNIYLARVTRVEPSLQAAFVEYGGNRHGFLAFSEIHPDYYQIPVEDREELLEAETKAALERSKEFDAAVESEIETETVKPVSDDDDDLADAPEIVDPENLDADIPDDESEEKKATSAIDESDEADRDAEIAEAAARRQAMRALKRKYNIQEVIKRRQVLLIQVVKEERGNKGAALTTYLSLAGRYCVLMPNSTHAGGISRKISNASDRRNLKKIISSLEVPEEMGLIVRTAGMARTKSEIKRDYDYLLRLWNGIRDLTLKSVAPTLVYEEGNLIKRTIRDLYTRDIDEILVEGEDGYKAAKDFMKLLMPSHAKKVQNYKDPIPLFHRYQVENHLEAMFQPIVQLRSGGYIVINPTEALISIDVNSGRATKEHNIEETALKTNMEAAEEVARQLRLRDMAGLVVIDFIDMEQRSNNRSVERRMKEVLKSDRARIQVGRISGFGLMEMSRQRLRSNLLEISMETCSVCAGTGIVRSIESAALMALRQLEEEGIRTRSAVVRVALCPEVAVYLLNKKRKILSDLETQYDFEIEVLSRTSMGPSDIEITREAGSEAKAPSTAISALKPDTDTEDTNTAEKEPSLPTHKDEDEDDRPKRKRRRRRRRRRGSSDDNQNEQNSMPSEGRETDDNAETKDDSAPDVPSNDEKSDENRERSRRRRGSRGGRRRNASKDASNSAETTVSADIEQSDATQVSQPTGDNASVADDTNEKPRRRRRRVRKPDSENTEIPTPTEASDAETDEKTSKPRRGRPRKVASESVSEPSAKESVSPQPDAEDKKPRRRTRKATADKPAVDEVKVEKTESSEKKPRTRKKSVGEPAEGEATNSDDKPKTRRRRSSPVKTSSKTTDAEVKTEPKKTATRKTAANTKSDSPTSAGAGASSDTDGQPKRKGWWQRTFG
ncbi:Rne/Rng family ribonuclease [Kordiimonas aquimaris]|uniref:Rne/Rng family ribonuclease n=1 Tax=Kordiimonas aquimaris TaxID=707591 RepID=UPI0021D13DAE|nr:Rne/Rng family ribonuclease [Kordiimonas aquimaris]